MWLIFSLWKKGEMLPDSLLHKILFAQLLPQESVAKAHFDIIITLISITETAGVNTYLLGLRVGFIPG